MATVGKPITGKSISAMFRRNIYSMTEVVEYISKRDADGIWRVMACRVIGHRKFINGQEVNDDGTPKSK